MSKRIRVILFFPLIAFIFMLGWILTVIGDRQTTKPRRKTRSETPKEKTKKSYLETGIIIREETEEKQIC